MTQLNLSIHGLTVALQILSGTLTVQKAREGRRAGWLPLFLLEFIVDSGLRKACLARLHTCFEDGEVEPSAEDAGAITPPAGSSVVAPTSMAPEGPGDTKRKMIAQLEDPQHQERLRVLYNAFKTACSAPSLLDLPEGIIPDPTDSHCFLVVTGRCQDPELKTVVDVGCAIKGSPLNRTHHALVAQPDGQSYSLFRGGEFPVFCRLIRLNDGDDVRQWVSNYVTRTNIDAFTRRYVFANNELKLTHG